MRSVTHLKSRTVRLLDQMAGVSTMRSKHGERFGPVGTSPPVRAFYKILESSLIHDSVCGEVDVPNCLGTHDPTIGLYTNTTTGNMVRSWQWLLYVTVISPRQKSDED